MTEHDLEKLAQRLGAGTAERLDVERAAQAVLARLREEPRVTALTWLRIQPAWLRIAAAVVLLAGASLVTLRLLQPERPPLPAVVSLAEDVSDLTAEQLRETVRSLDQPLGEAVAVETGLEGLTASELRALLRTLEG